MSTAADSFRRWRHDKPYDLPAILLAVLVIAMSVWIGAQARTLSAALATQQTTWRQSADQIATVRQEFRLPSSGEAAALIAESERMGSLGVPADERVNLIESMAKLAEASALADVRVNSGPTDSIYVVPRSIGSQSINAAPYTVTLSFSGSFAGVLRFVSSLPPYVSVARLGASRRNGVAAYQVVLLVYELNVSSAG